MTDTRRVCDLTAGELLEAGFARFADLGVTRGRWLVEIVLEHGKPRQLRPRIAGERPATIGRNLLDRRAAGS